MKEKNKSIKKISTEKLKLSVEQFKFARDMNLSTVKTTASADILLGIVAISDKNISLGEVFYMAGIGVLTVSISTFCFYCNLKAKTFEEELNYRNNNPEEQPKVYQKEINHTR